MVLTRLHRYAGFSILFSSEEKENAVQLKTTSNSSCHTGGGEDGISSKMLRIIIFFVEHSLSRLDASRDLGGVEPI